MWCKSVWFILLTLSLQAQIPSIAPGAKWKQIVLLKSNRSDVEKLVGVSQDQGHIVYYPISEGSLRIEYSPGFCKPQQVVDWNVAEWTVIDLQYVPFRNQPKFSSLNIDLKSFNKRPPALHTSEVSYYNDDAGIAYTVNEGELERVELYPSKKNRDLSCARVNRRKAPPVR